MSRRRVSTRLAAPPGGSDAPTRAPQRRMFVGALLALSMVAAACGGSDAEDATPASSDGVAAVAGARAGIVFVRDDGSAAAGSRTVFVATDVDSGEQTLVPVTGVGEEE